MELAREKGLSISEIALECEKMGITESFKEALVAGLYNADLITTKQACGMLGVPRRDFEGEILKKYGFTTYGNTDKEALREVSRIRRKYPKA